MESPSTSPASPASNLQIFMVRSLSSSPRASRPLQPRSRAALAARAERERGARSRELRVVALRDAPVVGAIRRPLPVLRSARAVAVVDALHLRGVFDARAERRDEVGEHVVPRAVASGSPCRLHA